VIVRFRAVGNAPILKKSVFKISDSSKFQAVISFLRKELGLKKDESLFLYVNQAFSPSPDEILSNLHKCFQTEGQLIISYCTSAAYG
ncbi:ubiquitin-like protein Atg12, partial [Paraphysoderma sedebokerense]